MAKLTEEDRSKKSERKVIQQRIFTARAWQKIAGPNEQEVISRLIADLEGHLARMPDYSRSTSSPAGARK